MQVNVLEAKNRLSELIRHAQAGEDVVIANRGVAVVRLTPVAKPLAVEQGRAFESGVTPETGNVAAILALLEKPRPAWMQRTTEEIDADIAAIRDGWD